VRRSTKVEPTAIQALATHFAATLVEGRGPADAYLTVARKRIALVATAIESRAARGAKASRPRLRFDRVALGLVDRLRTALDGSVPDGRTVVVTITAPIRLPARTAIAMEQRIRRLIATRAAPARVTATIHGNQIQVHFLKGGSGRTAELIGFVHNPDSDPTVLIDVARALLTRIGSGERTAGRRWLVIDIRDGLAPIETCRQVCSQLRVPTVFEQTLVLLPGGQIATLSA
jgi:hypothetical protein